MISTGKKLQFNELYFIFNSDYLGNHLLNQCKDIDVIKNEK
jgi:hypothetical protein